MPLDTNVHTPSASPRLRVNLSFLLLAFRLERAKPMPRDDWTIDIKPLKPGAS